MLSDTREMIHGGDRIRGRNENWIVYIMSSVCVKTQEKTAIHLSSYGFHNTLPAVNKGVFCAA